MGFARARGGERPAGRVEPGPGGSGVGPGTVEAVADHGVTGRGKVDSDLVGPAGHQAALDQRGSSWVAHDHRNLSPRRLACIVHLETPVMGSVAANRVVDLGGVERRLALVDGKVTSVHHSVGPGPSQRWQGLGVAGEEHGSGGQSIESMNQPNKGPASVAGGEAEQ